MNQTSGDSKKYDIIVDFISYKKEREKGLEVIASGDKDYFLNDEMTISAGKFELFENNSLKTEEGKVIANFVDYKERKEIAEERARISEKEETAEVIDYNELKRKRKETEKEQSIG